jgi:hypothetical protein
MRIFRDASLLLAALLAVVACSTPDKRPPESAQTPQQTVREQSDPRRTID